MKHLRDFSIFENNSIKDIELFLHNNLAYILDDYQVEVKDDIQEYGNDGRYKEYFINISIKKSKFKWDQIKYDFIPFFRTFK